ncbi:step II splicing factor slu7 [Tritrichomonas foetus]|uniref:Pre-mRNA-splicing factor SLU7 n=1 Tax=Tritrichomonas foetus TaxID=1144522 RepID=A0A1J4JGE5_9EUKA|nr:step II splicing factor slu7 [Tritrichomonas foetus]|eukprot:OHS98262.1 step II splicing factor slu7 [Tritrichomonas foetus]
MATEFDPDNLPPEGNLSGTRLPKYVKKAPWYFETKDTLDHLRMAPFAQQKYNDLDDFVKHGRSRQKEIVKWKPGSCRNCGAPTHTEFECTERPRKRNARVVGESIIDKEVIEEHDLSYEAKHDHYSNYDKNRWWHEVRGHFRYADQVRANKGNVYEEKVEIQEQFGHSGFRNRLDTAAYIEALDKNNKKKAEDDADLFVKPIAKDGEAKEHLLMAWEGDEKTRMKIRGIKKKNTKGFSINKPKMIDANAPDV